MFTCKLHLAAILFLIIGIKAMIFVRAEIISRRSNFNWMTFLGHLPFALEITYLDIIKKIVHVKACLDKIYKFLHKRKKNWYKFKVIINLTLFIITVS